MHDRLDEPNVNSDEFNAIHEAGHAVAAVVLGNNLVSVDIHWRVHQDGQISGGYVNSPWHVPKEVMGNVEAIVLPLIVQALAGPLAENRVHPLPFDHLAYTHDRQEAYQLAVMAVCERTSLGGNTWEVSAEERAAKTDKIDALLSKAQRDADALVSNHWESITQVAAQLLKHRSLTAAQVAEIVAANPPKAN